MLNFAIILSIIFSLSLLADDSLVDDLVDEIGKVEEVAEEASGPWYVSGFIGESPAISAAFASIPSQGFGSSTSGSLKANGHSWAIAVGRGLWKNARGEIELLYIPHSIGSAEYDQVEIGIVGATGKVVSRALTASIIYDFDMGRKWVPYAGWGIGYAVLSGDEVALSPDHGQEAFSLPGSYVLAHQFRAGVAYELNPGTSVNLDYRHIRYGSTQSFSSVGTINFGPVKSNQLMVGLRIKLGGKK